MQCRFNTAEGLKSYCTSSEPWDNPAGIIKKGKGKSRLSSSACWVRRTKRRSVYLLSPSNALVIQNRDAVLSSLRAFCLFVFALNEADAQSVASPRKPPDWPTNLAQKRKKRGEKASFVCCRCGRNEQELGHMLPPTERQGSCSLNLKSERVNTMRSEKAPKSGSEGVIACEWKYSFVFIWCGFVWVD